MEYLAGRGFARCDLMLGRPGPQARKNAGQHLPMGDEPGRPLMIDEPACGQSVLRLMIPLRREFRLGPVARMIDPPSAIVKYQPPQPIRADLLAQREDAFLRFPFDAIGMDFRRGGQDRQCRLKAISDLTIEVNPRRNVNGG